MKPILGCKWCGKQLGAKFERRCKDCGHDIHLHRVGWTSQRKLCAAPNCSCLAVQPTRLDHVSEQFPRQRVGFGLEARGLFCTETCAVNWAHKHAAEAR